MIQWIDLKRGVVAMTLALLFAGLSPIAAQAQSQLSGTAMDSTGAVVVGAVVAVRDVNTGVALTTTTNQSGIYRFPLSGYLLDSGSPNL